MTDHDNERPHTAQATQERIQELQWELLEYSPYSTYLAPSDVHLFGSLKITLVANISLMTKRLKRRCGSGRDKNQKTSMLGRDKCINVCGGCRVINVLSRFE
jgi:hypothetical protein